MILRVLCEKMVEMGKPLALVFVDYSAAFDSVSHKFVDTALKEAGATAKVRSICRAIYKAASAFTSVAGADGKQVRCDNFQIERGVLQGDIISPLFFILALELLLRRHDAPSTGSGVPLADTLIRLLGYADDVAVAEEGDEEGIARIETRVNKIADGSKEDADMDVNIEKTIMLHVREQERPPPTTREEALSVCKFECPHMHCNFRFHTMHGLKVHAGRCKWKDEFEVEKIVGHRGPIVARQYKIRWKGYSSDYDTFEPRLNIHPELIKDYEVDNQVYVYDWRFRCDVCDLPCSSARGISIHKAKSHKEAKQQRFEGTLADEAVKVCKMVEKQQERPSIRCGDQMLKNVFRSKYLGTLFTADAKQIHDIKSRIAMAYARCGKLRHVLDSPDLSVSLKLRLYQAAVCSVLTYGCETWTLSPVVMKMLNGANSKMLARFTGKSIPQEARHISSSYNLVLGIRVRRFRWLGHILRAGTSRLTYKAVEEQFAMGHPGNILMDAPPHTSIMDLTAKARDRKAWRALSRKIR